MLPHLRAVKPDHENIFGDATARRVAQQAGRPLGDVVAPREERGQLRLPPVEHVGDRDFGNPDPLGNVVDGRAVFPMRSSVASQ